MYAAEWPCCHDPLRFSLGSDDLSPQRGNPTRRSTSRAPLSGRLARPRISRISHTPMRLSRMLQGLARGSTPRPAHPLPRHTNNTLQTYYCRPPSLAISRFSSGFPYSPLCPPPACIRPSMSNATHLPHGIRLPGRLIQTNKTLQAYYCRYVGRFVILRSQQPQP